MKHVLFCILSCDLQARQLIIVLKIADPYSSSILRFRLALQVREEEKNNRVLKDLV